MSRKSLSGLILLGVFTAGVASSSAVSATGEPNTLVSGNIETKENAEKELSEQIEGENSDESTVDGSEDIENETNLAEETINEDIAVENKDENKEVYVYIDDKTKEQQAPAKGGKGRGVSLAKSLAAAGGAAGIMSSAAAGIKVGLSKEEPEPDNPQPEPGKEEEKPKEEEPKEEEKPNGLSAGAIAGIAVAGVIVIVVASVVSYLIYFRSKKCENASTIKNKKEVVQKELKSKLLEEGANKTNVGDFVNALAKDTAERLNNKMSNDKNFSARLAELVNECGKNNCILYLASLMYWCDYVSCIPYLASLVKECGKNDCILDLASLVNECGKNDCMLDLASLVNECGKNDCILDLASLVNECHTAKLTTLVKECHTAKLTTLVKECHTAKLAALVKECHTSDIARLATLINNSNHVAGTLAERLNDDNSDTFAQTLVQELNKKEFNVKKVCNNLLPIDNMNSNLINYNN